MKMTTEEAFVKVLQMNGIEHVFGIIGSAFMPISDLFPKAGITFWDVAHECNGGIMCDGYTRSTGKIALCIAQNGPGITNFVTVIRNAAERQGYQVAGFAPTSRAARQLNDAGIESGTLQGFLARAANPGLPEQRHFYFVDESSLASTNQMREFLSRLGPDDRVLLIGDIRQHQGVEAGRPFEQLQEAGMRTATLDHIVRQKDPALKSAVELLATGQVSAALDVLQQQGCVKEIPNQEERVRAIAKSYVE